MIRGHGLEPPELISKVIVAPVSRPYCETLYGGGPGSGAEEFHWGDQAGLPSV